MYLFVLLEKTAKTVSINGSDVSVATIKSARFTDDLTQRIYGDWNNGSHVHPDLNGFCSYFKVSESTADLASKIVNDPTNYCAVISQLINISGVNDGPPELILNETIVETSPSGGTPYSRTISNYNDNVRPAILRAGATSLFANL